MSDRTRNRRHTFEVARREVVTRSRSRIWRSITAMLVVASVALVIGLSILGEEPGGLDRRGVIVGVSGEVPSGIEGLLSDPGRSRLDVAWVNLLPAEVEAALADDVVDAVLIDGVELVWSQRPDPEIDIVLRQAIQEVEVRARAVAQGIDEAELAALLAPPRVSERVVDPDTSDDARTGIAVIAMVLTFVGIQAYGSLVVLGVVEEKANRVVEILLSQVRARELLAGKVIGIGVLAFAQMAVVLIGAAIALLVTDAFTVPASAFWLLPLVAVTFVLGFALYAVLFAVGGSLVSRQEDAQQVMLPAFIPLFAGYIIGFNAATSPESTLARVASFVPLTSPFVLPVRVASGEVPTVEVAAALVLLGATIWLLARLAGRVYEFTLLRTGTRIPLSDVVRRLRG